MNNFSERIRKCFSKDIIKVNNPNLSTNGLIPAPMKPPYGIVISDKGGKGYKFMIEVWDDESNTLDNLASESNPFIKAYIETFNKDDLIVTYYQDMNKAASEMSRLSGDRKFWKKVYD